MAAKKKANPKKAAPRGKRITTKAVQAAEDRPADLPRVDHKPENDDAEPVEGDGLTLRRRRFVEMLCGPAGFNPTKAAEMAGFAAENRNSLWATASRLLRIVKVRQAIARHLATEADTVEDARARLVELSRSSMENFLSYDEKGRLQLDPEQAAALGALGQVKEWSEERISIDDGPGTVVKRKIKLHDPRPLIEARLKMHGKLVERHEHTGADGGPIKTETTHKIDHDDYRRSFAEFARQCAVPGRGTPGDPGNDN